MSSKRNWVAVVVVGLFIAVGVTLFSPWASSNPDGLERVAEDKEFSDSGRDAPYEVIPGYTLPGVENERVATILSGVIGVLIVAAIAFGIGFVLRATARRRAAGAAPERVKHAAGG